jgi:hypothetical protein
MKPHHKKKSVIGLGIGVPVLVVGFVLMFAEIGPRGLLVPFLLVGIPFYIWGCLALARAKGYSTAIVLTAVLGLLFPLVVLLALPDKNKHYRGRET